MKHTRQLIAAILSACTVTAACAGGVSVSDPWVRGTVAAQKATGAFMGLTASAPTRLVGASSPAAAQVEVHEMTMENDVMKMRPVAALDLPAGAKVDLKPGGYHIMLMGLAKPLSEGMTVPMTLTFEAADGARETVDVEAPVRALTAAPMKHGMH
ncbi:copper chaperone PCu(A)C [Denitromonas iodatirespirans]|uniref:Copper chaperone PCu(A)C n=1 Tax=Denitromonas iodatirespirans TaxID=2795389 RepID=A0A944DAE0_DENI1|nr:copper chaperone PCu(A)C [Denitromonas iodatirespirans]MBT0960943.1 copper chaperone PCu(A)C [Denitromonas iodatirespirans]